MQLDKAVAMVSDLAIDIGQMVAIWLANYKVVPVIGMKNQTLTLSLFISIIYLGNHETLCCIQVANQSINIVHTCFLYNSGCFNF